MESRFTNITKGLLGLMIPLFFAGLATYQEITAGSVDKYVLGILMIFGLGALGYRVDSILEKVLEARLGVQPTKDKAPAAKEE